MQQIDDRMTVHSNLDENTTLYFNNGVRWIKNDAKKDNFGQIIENYLLLYLANKFSIILDQLAIDVLQNIIKLIVIFHSSALLFLFIQHLPMYYLIHSNLMCRNCCINITYIGIIAAFG